MLADKLTVRCYSLSVFSAYLLKHPTRCTNEAYNRKTHVYYI